VILLDDDLEALLNLGEGGVEVAGEFGFAHVNSGSHRILLSRVLIEAIRASSHPPI